MLAAVGVCNAAELQRTRAQSCMFVAPIIRLRGGGFPQLWANKPALQDAPERWKDGLAKLRAMCTGDPSETVKASRGSRLAGLWLHAHFAVARWCLRRPDLYVSMAFM